MDRLRTIFTEIILVGVSEELPEDERALRAGLVADLVAPTLQRYLTGKL